MREIETVLGELSKNSAVLGFKKHALLFLPGLCRVSRLGGVHGRLAKEKIGIGLGILGLAGWLGYHSLVGDGGSSSNIDKIPAKVFAGGAGELSLRVSMNQPGYLAASFGRGEEEDESLHATQQLEAGDHYFKIDLPADLSYGYFELEIRDATIGAKLDWTAEFEGRVITTESEELDQPLGKNQAFFLQLEFSDLDELRSYAENSEGDDGDEEPEED